MQINITKTLWVSVISLVILLFLNSAVADGYEKNTHKREEDKSDEKNNQYRQLYKEIINNINNDDIEEAEKLTENIPPYLENIKDPEEKANAYSGIAFLYAKLENIRKAFIYINKSIDVTGNIKNTHEKDFILGHVAEMQCALGQCGSALKTIKTILSPAEKIYALLRVDKINSERNFVLPSALNIASDIGLSLEDNVVSSSMLSIIAERQREIGLNAISENTHREALNRARKIIDKWVRDKTIKMIKNSINSPPTSVRLNYEDIIIK